MRVLVACEFSGRVRDAFLQEGHDAISCDLLPTESPGPHYQCDVKEVINKPWDLIIAHPPCTYLCNSGVRWLHSDPNRWSLMNQAVDFFALFLNNMCGKVAIENPVMHKHAKKILWEKYGIKGPQFTVQPWYFGDDFKKRTCFWTRGLDDLQKNSNLDGSTAIAEVHKMGPSKDRGKKRSLTYKGLAKAMAKQWGENEA